MEAAIMAYWDTFKHSPCVINILRFIKQQSEIYVNTVELCAAPVHLKVSPPPLFDVVFIVRFRLNSQAQSAQCGVKADLMRKPAGTH